MWASVINRPKTTQRIITNRQSICICQSVVAPSPPNFSGRSAEAATTRNDFTSVLGLVQWAIANKIRFTGCRPDIRNGVRGVYATSDISGGDNLVAVPLQSSLVVRPGERCPFPDFITQDVWSQLPWFAQLACKLLHERALGPASRFADYLPALPERIDLPALWPSEHVRQLQYPYLEQQILDEQEEWAGLYDRVRRYLDRRGLTRADFFWSLSCVRSRTFAGPHIPTPAPVKFLVGVGVAGAAAAVTAAVPAEPAGVVTTLLPAVLAAVGVPALWQITEARRAASGEPGTVLYAVCPFIDMFNHDSRSQSECVFAPWRDEFRVAAGETLWRGQQVLINYGNQSNDALLQRYGFVQLDGNPHDRYVVQDMRPLLEAALTSQLAIPAEVMAAAVRSFAAPAGSLDQVVLTAAGAPQQTLQAVAALLAVFAGRQSMAPLQSEMTALPSVEALVAAACREERAPASSSSSLKEDEAALAELAKWELCKEEVAAVDAAEVERRAAAGPVPAGHVATQTSSTADEGEHVFCVDIPNEADGDLEAGRAATQVRGGEGDVVGLAAEGESGVPLETLMPQIQAEPILPPLELATFGGIVERYRTVLMFRIAKKRMLQKLANIS